MKKFLLSFLCFLLAVAGGYAEDVTDELNRTTTGITTTTYSSWSGKQHKSAAVYAGQSAGGNSSIQLRSDKSNSGIITTTSGGKVKKIVVVWNSKTTSGRILDIYGKNTAYSDPKELYNSSTQGTKLGSIKYGTSTELVIDGDYEYIGFRSNSGAMYLSRIEITWDNGGTGGEETPVAPNAPTLTPSCSFDNKMSVEITNISENSTVYYTTDGTDPSTSNGEVYSAPLVITETTTVNAIAVKGELSSEVVSATYTKNEVPETPENVEGGTVTFIAENKNYENGSAITTVEIDDYVTASFDKGTNSNPPKYYTSGTAIRCYGGNTFTISSTAGNITKIVLTYGNSDGTNVITTNVGTFGTDTWTGRSKNVTFTIDGTSGNRRIAKISVTYEGTNSGTPDVENVQAPVISCNKEEYAVGEEAVVTITTATEDATIYYSLDGNDPTTEYTSAITLNETTTIKAIAKKDGANNSPLAEKTIVFKEVVTLVNATVAEAIAAYKSGKTITENASIVGYIVGAANNSLSNDGNFSGTTTVDKNLLIADDPNETNVENCMPVQLPSGIRSALNLKDNPSNYKRRVILTGTVGAYFSVAGLKNTSAYEFVEDSWGTLYSSKDIDIPGTVQAYIVTNAYSNYVSLKQITGALPAGYGIVYYGFWRPNFDKVATNQIADVSGNLLKGTTSDTYINEEAYVLAKVEGVVGFYKAAMNQEGGTAFLNNANKAYLPVSALPESVQNAKALKFNFDTTGVEGVKVETEGKKVIYDLSGRRVNEMTQPGIYIVNGKKVMVK